jgi:hypothetical protein
MLLFHCKQFKFLAHVCMLHHGLCTEYYLLVTRIRFMNFWCYSRVTLSVAPVKPPHNPCVIASALHRLIFFKDSDKDVVIDI